MNEKYHHIFLDMPTHVQNYTSPSTGGRDHTIPDRPRKKHSDYLRHRFNEAWKNAENEQLVYHTDRNGVYLEFVSDPNADLITRSLEDMQSKKVRLLNVRKEKINGDEITYATVYVAHEKKRYFLDKIEDYAKKDTPSGKPKNWRLLNSIRDLRKALLVESFWQDKNKLIPTKDKKEWCEVWLSSDKKEVLDSFESLLEKENIETTEGYIRFPERTVKIIYANRHDLEKLTTLSDDIAEYRKAKETASFWLNMGNKEQKDWVEDLLERIQINEKTDTSICILDTGVNNGHPLITPILSDEDCHFVNTEWGENDHGGHGTLMAGVCTYGDLIKCLEETGDIPLRHLLESSKILPPPPERNPQNLWGYITSQGVSLAEIQAPLRKRIFCLAVSANDTMDNGRPSSWSGKLDQVSSGAEDGIKRLFVVCSGNVPNLKEAVDYPYTQLNTSIQDPAQSWNALTVGAYTELNEIKDYSLENYFSLANSGELSPYSTTSLTWDDKKWPKKPDIVMEGGNLAYDGESLIDESDDLSLISTYYKPHRRQFFSFNQTSAATAKAAWFAAQIQSSYPDMWPETIRGLMVHSARWTEELKAEFLQNENKSSYAQLLRICGYGVPNIDSAIYSMSNSVTLITQQEIQPFIKKDDNSGYRTNEMHLYELPWPKEILYSLPDDAEVQMRVTLSYFIELGPGEIGWEHRYRYQSHALRFEVKSPTELQTDFIKRINAAAQDEEGSPDTKSAASHWLIGYDNRHNGSIHSDIWKGTPQELADSESIAIFPVIGWWRERPHLKMWDKKTRYSLIISITTSKEGIDIYTPIATKVGISVSTVTNI